MEKEVEIKPKHFTDITNQIIGFNNLSLVEDATKDKMSGVLRDDGKLLDISLNINAVGSETTANLFMLDYNVIDYYNRTVSENALTDIIVKLGIPAEQEYNNIDLSKVRTIPKPVIDTTLHESIDIQLFTYEANIETEYGNKRLSVPYKVMSTLGTSIPTSTDGLYTIHFATVRSWNASSPYVSGQIVVQGGNPYTCKVSNIGIPVTDSVYWNETTEEDFRSFSSGNTSLSESNTLITGQFGMLITRQFKQTLLYDVVSGLSFRTEDDSNVLYTLNLMKKFRELAVIYLEKGDTIKADYLLEKAKTQYIQFKTGKFNKNTITNSRYSL